MQTPLKYTGDSQQEATVRLISYNEASFEEYNLSQETSFLPFFREGNKHWLQICGMNNPAILETIVREFGIRLSDAQLIVNNRYPAKIDVLENNVILIFNSFSYFNKKLRKERAAIILGDNYLITLEEFAPEIFGDILQTLKDNVYKIRQKSVDVLLYRMLDQLMTSYGDIVNQIENGLENLEAELLNYNKTNELFGKRIQYRKQEYMRLKKAIIPLKEQFNKLQRYDSELILPDNMPYFNDINDQLQALIHSLDACREITSSLVDIYMSNNDLRMNSIMKQLTIVSTIFIPLTFLVGVWGMNFDYMPELAWKYGYLAFWILTLVLAFVGWIYFKKRKWF